MNELVYLFELDSVNKSPEDVIVAHKAILNEIVNNGNTVVLSMNQLTDSKALSDMLLDEKKYQYLLELFKNGSLLVSLYDDIRTPSQYIQLAIDRCLADNNDTFIFSNLPIKSNDYVLLKIVKDALRYSDLSLLTEFNCSDKAKIETNSSEQDFIKRFINLVLEISKNDYGRNPPKNINKRTFSVFMDSVLNHYKSNPTKCISADVIQYLYGIQNNLIDNSKEHRSKWIDLVPKENYNKNDIENIINLIYNYTIEDSILNVKKSYSESKFEESFFADFERRLNNQLKGTANNLDCELSEKDWEVAVRISKLKNKKSELYLPFSINNKHVEWMMFIFKETMKYIFLTIIFVLLFFFIEYILSLIESIFDSILGVYLTNAFLMKLVTIFIFGLLGSLLSALFDLPDIFTCIKKLVFGIYDLIVVIGGKYEYRNKT